MVTARGSRLEGPERPRGLVRHRHPGAVWRRRAPHRRRARHRDRVRARRGGPGPRSIVPKPVLATEQAIREVLLAATAAPACIGVIAWMHTFSPARMWIAGPPRAEEAAAPPAHAAQPRSPVGGDRHGLHEPQPVGPRRPRVRRSSRVACDSAGRRWSATGRIRRSSTGSPPGPGPPRGVHELRRLRLARFGDNMRQVAVTEGDKVEAQIQLGVRVDGYGVGDLPRPSGRRASRTSTGSSTSTTRPTTWRRRCGATATTGRPLREAARHRGRPPELPRRRRLRRLHRHLRGSRRPRPAARASPSNG